MWEGDIRFSGIGTTGDKMMDQKTWSSVKNSGISKAEELLLEREIK